MICSILIVKLLFLTVFGPLLFILIAYFCLQVGFFLPLVTGMLCGWTVANVTNFTITKGL